MGGLFCFEDIARIRNESETNWMNSRAETTLVCDAILDLGNFVRSPQQCSG